MRTFLLTWVTDQWKWYDHEPGEPLPQYDYFKERWRTERGPATHMARQKHYSHPDPRYGTTRDIVTGDRVFLMRCGGIYHYGEFWGRADLGGLVGDGYATSNGYADAHWDENLAREGAMAEYVEVDWRNLIDLRTKRHKVLHMPQLRRCCWFFKEIYLESVRLLDDLDARDLERAWANCLSGRSIDEFNYRSCKDD